MFNVARARNVERFQETAETLRHYYEEWSAECLLEFWALRDLRYPLAVEALKNELEWRGYRRNANNEFTTMDHIFGEDHEL